MNSIKRIALVLCLTVLSLAAFPAAARAQSIIKQPGNHPDYSFELEPHFVFQWGARYGVDDGFGPGIRFSIPFTRNGPIPSINNNMGITFGFDLTFGGDYCYPYNRGSQYCNSTLTEFWFPVAMQWNFFLTKVISVFGEPGFAIAHHHWSYDYCAAVNVPGCHDSNGHTTFEPVFEAGGRFMFSDRVGAIVRIGYPMFSGGINILF
jgi:hypothetical protein